ncbi:MAG: hypothetical protein ACK6C7_20485, partial [Pseudanabaena sp.]
TLCVAARRPATLLEVLQQLPPYTKKNLENIAKQCFQNFSWFRLERKALQDLNRLTKAFNP